MEAAVGAYLLARGKQEHFDVHWWREGTAEVDYVLSQGNSVIAIEVRSGRVKRIGGLGAFVNRFPAQQVRTMVIGSAEYPIESFLLGDVALF